MKIGHKLILSFLALAVFGGVPYYFSLQAHDDIDQAFLRLKRDPIPTIKVLEALKFSGMMIGSSVAEFSHKHIAAKETNNTAAAAGEEEGIGNGYKRFEELLAEYDALSARDVKEEAEYYNLIRDAWERLRHSSNDLIEAQKQGVSRDVLLNKEVVFEAQKRAYLTTVDNALAFEYLQLDYEQGNIEKTITLATNKSLILGAFSILIAVILGIFTSLRIAGKIERLKIAAEGFGRGELNTPINVKSKDELGALAQAFTDMAYSIRNSQGKLRASHDFVDNVLSSMADALFVLSPHMEITRVNEAACSIAGMPEKYLLGMSFRSLTGLNRLLDKSDILQLEESGSIRGFERTILDARGQRVTVLASASKINGLDDSVNGYVIVMQDITGRKRLEDELTHQAMHDALTGLPNRTYFTETLQQALERARRDNKLAGVLYIDLDNFKKVNDSLGHSAGDRMLAAVSGRIESCLRNVDMAARLGGDEFAVVVEHLSEKVEFELIARRILHSLSDVFLIEGNEFFVSASIGIAISDDKQGHAPEELLRNADMAMYFAKERGKAGFSFFEPKMHDEMIRRVGIEADLRNALRNNELFLNYHPIIDLKTGGAIGMETLVRWKHPVRGIVQPLDFIPVAESSGLILEIGKWILEEACTQARYWKDEFYANEELSLMVNLSAREFQDPSLEANVAYALAKSGLPAECLVLEITETMMMHDTDAMIEKLYKLKEQGVRLAIDDFGTGYSSLSYLERFPVDILKIDKSFVNKIEDGREGAALTSAIISMCNTLKLKTIGEGIEKPGQAAELSHLGCGFGQGYHFTKPLNKQSIYEFLSRHNPVSMLGTFFREHPGEILDFRLG